MTLWFQHKFNLSPERARGLLRGSLWNAAFFWTLMLSMGLIAYFVEQTLPAALGKGPVPAISPWVYLLATPVCVAVMAFCYVKQYNAVFVSVYRESEEKRIRLGEQLRQLPLAFFHHKDLSDLTGRLMEDVNVVEEMLSHAIPQIVGAAITTVLVGLCMLAWQWQMGLALIWVIPIVVINHLLSGRLQRKHAAAHLEAKLRVSEQTQENLEHMADILACNRSADFNRQFGELLAEEEKRHIISEIVMSVFCTGGQALLKLGFATTVLAGTYLLATGKVGLFTFLLYVVASARVYDPISGVLMNLSHVYFVAAPIERMRELEKTPLLEGKAIVPAGAHDISFEGVSYSYLEGREVLHDVSFKAEAGQITALIGPSGCGKSTLAKLAARFYDPSAGCVRIGGVDLSTADPEALMDHISMVFQDVLLFDNTVLENIRIGRQSATDEEVYEAARLAHCDEFIRRLPEGYQTRIGENGSKLSGGERQRISIARALLKKAPILLLDEATASLDVENESLIQEGLQELIRGKTVLVIAHRMRTIERADKIVGLTEGRLVEVGSPAELGARPDSLYSRLRSRQRGEA